MELDGASDRLRLFKADVLDSAALAAAVEGCQGVFHFQPLMLWHIVDVRDVADALLLVYEKPESSGRYISAPNYIFTKTMLELLKKTYPNYNYVKCKDNADQSSAFTPISSEKLKNLGWKPRALEDTLLDSVEYYKKTGILQDAEGEGQVCRQPDLFQLFHAAEE
ncbi:unnamed protein product [Alopecurus aequalis]